MSNYEEGLIQQYVSELRACAVRAENGENVLSAVDAVLEKAVEHFRFVKSSDPQANLLAFKSRIKLTAELTHPSQPEYRAALEYAYKYCPGEV